MCLYGSCDSCQVHPRHGGRRHLLLDGEAIVQERAQGVDDQGGKFEFMIKAGEILIESDECVIKDGGNCIEKVFESGFK